LIFGSSTLPAQRLSGFVYLSRDLIAFWWLGWKSAFLLEGQPILHVVDRVAGDIKAILMPVGIALGIAQHSLVSGKTPAADMLAINFLELHLTHTHTYYSHPRPALKWASRCCVSGRTTADPKGLTRTREAASTPQSHATANSGPHVDIYQYSENQANL